jgi:tRNA pseudouridine38-40 synthase
VRIALGLQYDGAPFPGWQTQPDRRAVQDVVQAALSQFAAEPVQVICAGRTDAGVHATSQVVHLDTAVEREPGAWVRGANRYLPPHIAIQWSALVADDFHARYSARSRTYEHWIYNHAVRSALLHARTSWVFRDLNVEAMRLGARALLGRHDFSSFRSSQCQAASPVREIFDFEVERIGRFVRIRVRANAFLHHMVRNLAGALVWVGVGRRPAAWVAEALAARERSAAAPTLDAAGLYLTGVEYDPAFGLPIGQEPDLRWTVAAVHESRFAV